MAIRGCITLLAGLPLAAVIFVSEPALAQVVGGNSPVQTVPANQAPPVAARTQATQHARQAPTVTVFGAPVTADAPVSPSYDGTAYKTLAGQPETGADAIAGQTMQPTDASPR